MLLIISKIVAFIESLIDEFICAFLGAQEIRRLIRGNNKYVLLLPCTSTYSKSGYCSEVSALHWISRYKNWSEIATHDCAGFVCDCHGNTPLHFLAERGNVSILINPRSYNVFNNYRIRPIDVLYRHPNVSCMDLVNVKTHDELIYHPTWSDRIGAIRAIFISIEQTSAFSVVFSIFVTSLACCFAALLFMVLT